MSNKKIKNINELSVPSSDNMADVYINKIIFEGDSETRKPLSFLATLENNSQKLKLVTWDYGLIETIKKIHENKTIAEIKFNTQEFRNELNHKLSFLTDTGKVSSHANEEDAAEQINNAYTPELFTQLIDQINNNNYKALLQKLIINNDKFFKWPAAKSVHHAFPGGLAKHSYNVAVNALNLASVYESQLTIDYALLTTGALLHDIGKLEEYKSNGEISFKGNFMTHLVMGVEIIDKACYDLGIDPESNDILLLKHIIVSHHGKLEYGSPSKPIIPEAYIVSFADGNDAGIESLSTELYGLNDNAVSKPLLALDGGRIIKLN